jgi:two-component system CheB/CheR fusion protein
MPVDTASGMAYLLVQHLAPEHPSMLREIIQRCTPMQVFEVRHGMVVERDCVYVIPPDRVLLYLDGMLVLRERARLQGGRQTIDILFNSLARQLRDRSVGIVLSGSGSDGSLGLRAIKEVGGLTMVQTPTTARFQGMPQSALETGIVDIALPPERMAAHLMGLNPRNPGGRRPPKSVAAPWPQGVYMELMQMLRGQTGHDFSQYKVGTIRRRIERRMAVHRLDSLPAYAAYLRQTPKEVQNLYLDLPIGVTAFFRDPEAFRALERDVLPRLLSAKGADGVLRIWSVGCSTGEEPYSIGMLVAEAMERQQQQCKVQIFATDLDARAIAIARVGRYAASIEGELSAARLSRFFTPKSGSGTYRVLKSLRDMMVFSEHDVIRDPPFSRMDLIVCRNLLIYFDGELQKRLIPLFYYALQPSGTLFLGTSESVGENADLFSLLDRRAKLFQCREDARSTRPGYSAAALLAVIRPRNTTLPRERKRDTPMKSSLREMAEQALLLVAPASALVNAQGDIRYLHGRTGRFLEPSPGETGVSNILEMAREGLRPVLEAALLAATAHHDAPVEHQLDFRSDGRSSRVKLTVRPLSTQGGEPPDVPLYLVVFEDTDAIRSNGVEAAEARSAESAEPTDATDSRLETLRRALKVRDEHLRSMSKALERSSEELRSSNDQMQAVNEELQSTNEELETSKEELQAVNEELTTVNTELQIKVSDLSRANNDLNNLLSGTGIGTLFLDHDLRVLRFTPATSTLIHLIPSDVGRHISHIATNLIDYNSLVSDVRTVLDTLENIEIDVQTAQHRWYTMRIQPYRTQDNVIEGAVVTFVDITEVRTAREALRLMAGSSELGRMLSDADADAAMVVEDLDGRTQAWNEAACRLYGWDGNEAQSLPVHARIPDSLRADHEARLTALRKGDAVTPWQTQRLCKNASVRDVWVTATALRGEQGALRGLVWVEQPLVPPATSSGPGQ